MRIVVVVSLGILLGSLAIDARARADDPPAAPAEGDSAPQIKALLVELDAAIAAKDDLKVAVITKKAPALYKASADLIVRGRFLCDDRLRIKVSEIRVTRKALALSRPFQSRGFRE